MNRRVWLGLFAATLVSSCQIKPLPDPNDPNQAGLMQADVLRSNLRAASDAINERVGKGEITDERGQEIVRDHAKKLLDSLKIEAIPVSKAWEYADVLLTAQRWKDAEKVLRIALAHPPNEDRRVNDTLRLARCEAELGQPDAAIATTRLTFNADPHWKWPILYAVYLEIVPAALQHSQGHELELARLIEDAIKQHEAAVADPAKLSDRGWLAARSHHIMMAWQKIGEIYASVNRNDLAQEARKRASETVTAIKV